MTMADLRDAVVKGPLGNMLLLSDKGYYHSIRRLALRGVITKAHDRLFTAAGLSKFSEDVKSGKVSAEFLSGGNTRKSPMGDAILRFVGERGEVKASIIIDFLLSDDRFSGPVGRNRSSAYNVLARLLSRGQLTKVEGGGYRVPDRNAEAQ